MQDIGSLTVVKAKLYQAELATLHETVRARIDSTRRRIHEIAPATRDYELTELGLSLDEVDAEFYSVCKKTTDPQAMAHRFGVDPETVAGWARQANSSTEARVVRMVVTKDQQTVAYAMGFSAGRQAVAESLLIKFRETLEKYNWVVTAFGPAPAAQPDDVILADA
jgi:hypothetical protein